MCIRDRSYYGDKAIFHCDNQDTCHVWMLSIEEEHRGLLKEVRCCVVGRKMETHACVFTEVWSAEGADIDDFDRAEAFAALTAWQVREELHCRCARLNALFADLHFCGEEEVQWTNDPMVATRQQVKAAASQV